MKVSATVDAWQFPSFETDVNERAAPLEDARAFLDHVRARAALREEVAQFGDRLWAVTRKQYDRMKLDEREAFNDARRALLSHETISRTRRVIELREAAKELFEGPRRYQRGGYYVAGPAGVGKTTALTDALAAGVERHYGKKWGAGWFREETGSMKREWTNASGDRGIAREVLVVPMMMPSRPSSREITRKMLHSLSCAAGDPSLAADLERSRQATRMPEARLTDVLVDRMRIHGVRVIAIDELHFVCGDARGTEVVNHLKHLLNRTTAGLVLAGVSGAAGMGLTFRESGRTATDDQLRRRFKTMDFEPFPEPVDDGSSHEAEDEWANAVSLLACKVVLLDQDDGFWSDPATLTYMWRRTGGVYADLEELIRRAGEKAIGRKEGTECVDKGVLEGVRLSDEAELGRLANPRGQRRKVVPGVSKRGRLAAERLRKASVHGVGVAIDAQTGVAK